MSGGKSKRMPKAYSQHLDSSKDLVTTYEAVRAGFVALALEKNRRATPLVAEARALKAAASRARNPIGLLGIAEIQTALLTAAGVSDKAAKHLEPSNKQEAVEGLIRKYLEPAGANFVEELVFRFLLTRGDTLGGSMRNVGGFLAQKKLTRSIIAHLRLAGKTSKWLHSKTKTWVDLSGDDTDVELFLRGLSWSSPRGHRTLIYNRTIPFLKNNVDLSLFDCSHEQLAKDVYGNAGAYMAVGELKGGIDPAGADEHWKTAIAALDRIRKAFTKRRASPHIFFIGAAIEVKMAAEIWKSLRSGTIENAANLTDEDQLASVTQWLCSL